MHASHLLVLFILIFGAVVFAQAFLVTRHEILWPLAPQARFPCCPAYEVAHHPGYYTGHVPQAVVNAGPQGLQCRVGGPVRRNCSCGICDGAHAGVLLHTGRRNAYWCGTMVWHLRVRPVVRHTGGHVPQAVVDTGLQGPRCRVNGSDRRTWGIAATAVAAKKNEGG
jgi:hypothetical protein